MLSGNAFIPSAGRYTVVLNAFQPAIMKDDTTDPVSYVEHSLTVLAQVLAQIDDQRCDRIIYTSSSSVYGPNANCSESDPTLTTGVYGAMKIAGEELLRSFCRSNALTFTIVRPFNLFGGADRFSVIFRLLNAVVNQTPFQLINNGESIRDYVHVDDAAKVFKSLMSQDSPEIINIGRGEPSSVRNLLKQLNDAGYQVVTRSARRDEVPVCVANTELLRSFAQVDQFRDPGPYLISTLASLR